jgi:hypothetical protein
MTASERARFYALLDRVAVFPGFAIPVGRRGIAWTVDRQRAGRFARAHAIASHLDGEPRDPWVASATVKREQIVACLDGRAESDVVI